MTNLKENIRCGDIVNFKYPKVQSAYLVESLETCAVSLVISADQRKVFCQKADPKKVEFQHYHTEIYLGDTNVFSEQPPEALWLSMTDLDHDDGVIDIYRMNPEYFKHELTTGDIKTMQDIAWEIIKMHKPYSVGNLLNILCDTIAGYPQESNVSLFTPFDGKPLVCSVAVMSILAKWRHNVRETTDEHIPQPFKVLNPNFWSDEFIRNWKGHWSISTIPPAIFANSGHFQNEFIHVGSYHQGKRIS